MSIHTVLEFVQPGLLVGHLVVGKGLLSYLVDEVVPLDLEQALLLGLLLLLLVLLPGVVSLHNFEGLFLLEVFLVLLDLFFDCNERDSYGCGG